ncbi:hypothetical protein H0H92_009110, partial [Tricholoma furcatifolium]
TGEKKRWKESVLRRVANGIDPQYNPNGRRGILGAYPAVIKKIQKNLEEMRASGLQMTVITARGVILANIQTHAPEVLTMAAKDGSSFRASDAFVRKFLHGTMNWSHRCATRAAQKLPDDWEEICAKSALRKAYNIKEHDIPIELWVNSDQTQNLYAPGDKMTYAETGTKQVSVVGLDEKRAFTVLVSVTASGKLLPFQAIYAGKSRRSLPNADAPFYAEAIAAGFHFEFSNTDTYWSNQQTMRNFVNNILAPYFDDVKREKGLPPTQKAMWTIDVWSVHRSVEFITWMKENHSSIILDFVPGNCTGVAQPCDVGIQRPLKLSTKRSYHEDIVEDFLQQMKGGAEKLIVEKRVGVMRDRSVRWLWNAFTAVNRVDLIQKAFAMCRAQDLDLSYACLTGFPVREKLRNLRSTDPDFWAELNHNQTESLPALEVVLPEDQETEEDVMDGLFDDASEIPVDAVIEHMVNGNSTELTYGLTITMTGGLQLDSASEQLDATETDFIKNKSAEVVEGRGQRRKWANKLYSTGNFWQH